MRKYFFGRRSPVENKGSYLRCAGRCGRYRLRVDFNPRRRRALYVANACGCGNRRYSRLEKRTVDNPYLHSSGACRGAGFCGVQIGRARAYGRDGRIYFRFRFRRRDFGACKTYPGEKQIRANRRVFSPQTFWGLRYVTFSVRHGLSRFTGKTSAVSA